jgi:hypothetical protein
MILPVGMAGAARRAAMATAASRGSLWNLNFVSRSRGDGDCFPRQYVSVVLSNVYPDVSASAACVRTNFIVHGLAKLPMQNNTNNNNNDDYDYDYDYDYDASVNNRVYYATSVDVTNKDHQNHFGRDHLHPSDNKHSAAIQIIHLPPNRSDLMEEHFFMGAQPPPSDSDKERSGEEKSCDDGNDVDLVVFDRFFVEEAHSFRFRQAFPTAALVLDMQDMHSLRWGRQRIVEAWDKEQKKQTQQQNQQQQQQQQSDWDPLGCLPQVLDYLPTLAETNDDRFVRELASIHRSDLVLVCSPRELDWLKTVCKVPEEKLCLASFFVEECRDNFDKNTAPLPQSPSAGDDALVVPPRFVFCGGFKHAPNADAVRILIDSVWPFLRSELPEATLHIYGAFCPHSLLAHNRNNNKNSNNNKSHGIHVHGYEPDLAEIFGQDGGILLAPLRFGAGIKGKIVDAWTFGMPVVTTPIGSEGMTIVRESESEFFGGSVASTLKDFCEKAIDLAKNPEAYRKAQARGKFLLKELFSASENWRHVRTRLMEILDKDSLARKRRGDYTQAMLWHQSLRSTEYFSRWVELKETVVRNERRRGVSAPVENPSIGRLRSDSLTREPTRES